MFSIIKCLPKRIRRLVGVDIGPASLRAVEIVLQGKNAMSFKQGRIESPPGIESGSFIPEQLAGILAQLFADSSIGQCRVNMSVGGNRIITRCVMMPEMPPGELKQALKWEAEKYLPLSQGEHIIRHVMLQEFQAEGVRQRVLLLAAAPRELVERYHRAFSGAGLNIVAIDLPYLALWRIFTESGFLGKGDSFVVEIGASMARLVVCQGRYISFTRSISLPPGLSAGDRKGIIELGAQLKRSLEYCRSQGRVTEVDKTILCGSSALCIDGMAKMLASELGMQVETGAPRFYDGANYFSMPPEYALAAGLALGEC